MKDASSEDVSELCQSVEEGRSKVPNSEAPARKRRKGAVTQLKRTTRGQKNATEPGQSTHPYTVKLDAVTEEI